MGDEKEDGWGISNWFGDEVGGTPVEELHTELIEETPTPDLPAIIKSKDVNTFVLSCTSCGKNLPLESTDKGEHICDHCDEIHTIDELGELKSTGLKLDRKKKKKEEKTSNGSGFGLPTKVIFGIAVVTVTIALGYILWKKRRR